MAIAVTIQFLTLLFASWLLARFYQNRQKLKSFPGPFLASLTDIWFFLQQQSGKSWNTILGDLHESYGPVVRFGPHRLSFTDPAAIETIYGYHPLLIKVGT